MNDNEIVEKILAEQKENIQKYIAFMKAKNDAQNKYLDAIDAHDDAAAHQAALERNENDNEASAIKIWIYTVIRRETGRSYDPGVWNVINRMVRNS